MGKGRRQRQDEVTASAPSAPRFHRDMLVCDALELNAGVQAILESIGLPCHRCIVAYHETLSEGCQPLGHSVDDLLARMNALPHP